MDLLIIFGLIYGLPAASLVFFISSLRKFCRASKGSEERKSRRFALILSSIVCGVVFAALTAFMVLFISALANM